jgi:hypothetical protein
VKLYESVCECRIYLQDHLFFCSGVCEWRGSLETTDQGEGLQPEKGAVLCRANHTNTAVSSSAWNCT